MNWPRICTSAVAVTMFILSSERATCAEPAAGDLPAMLKAKGYTAVPLKIMKNGHLDVDVKVKGETLRFILDTGAGSTVIDVVVAKRLGFQVVKTDKTHAGVTGSAMLEKTTIDQLSVGRQAWARHLAAFGGRDRLPLGTIVPHGPARGGDGHLRWPGDP